MQTKINESIDLAIPCVAQFVNLDNFDTWNQETESYQKISINDLVERRAKLKQIDGDKAELPSGYTTGVRYLIPDTPYYVNKLTESCKKGYEWITNKVAPAVASVNGRVNGDYFSINNSSENIGRTLVFKGSSKPEKALSDMEHNMFIGNSSIGATPYIKGLVKGYNANGKVVPLSEVLKPNVIVMLHLRVFVYKIKKGSTQDIPLFDFSNRIWGAKWLGVAEGEMSVASSGTDILQGETSPDSNNLTFQLNSGSNQIEQNNSSNMNYQVPNQNVNQVQNQNNDGNQNSAKVLSINVD